MENMHSNGRWIYTSNRIRGQHADLIGDAVVGGVSFDVFAGFCGILAGIENSSVFRRLF
jgi:hypothetical protein